MSWPLLSVDLRSMTFVMWELQKGHVYAVASRTIDSLLTRFQAALTLVNGKVSSHVGDLRRCTALKWNANTSNSQNHEAPVIWPFDTRLSLFNVDIYLEK
jgi:hypothetical protein